MQVQINGEKKSLDQEATVTQLLTLENVEMPELVSVELNGEFLDRQLFDATNIQEGDVIEFLYFMGGGSYGV